MDWLDVKEFFKDALKYILIAVGVLLLILYVVSLQQVVGPSMNPTLQDQDVLILNKFYYRIFEPKRNDVVSFDYEDTKYLIKRVIGLPGEHIEYKDNLLYIDGKAYEENNITIETEDFKLEDLGYEKIPEDMYLVLGDNRGNSLDSRNFGLISKSDLIGKVWLKVWPINEFKFVK